MTDEKKEYPRPSLTADVVVMALGETRGLRALFVRRARDPFQGMWALPGGFVEPTETVAEAAVRELREETSLDGVRVEEIGCFSRPGRDPRGWVVTIAHLALVPADRVRDVKAGDDAAAAEWLDLSVQGKSGAFTLSRQGEPLPLASALAFDHAEILAAAVKRLFLDATEHALCLLPATFSLAELRVVGDAIGGNPSSVQERLPELPIRETAPGSRLYTRAGLPPKPRAEG
jgi:8-oxo-dGTP diphosphatase